MANWLAGPDPENKWWQAQEGPRKVLIKAHGIGYRLFVTDAGKLRRDLGLTNHLSLMAAQKAARFYLDKAA